MLDMSRQKEYAILDEPARSAIANLSKFAHQPSHRPVAKCSENAICRLSSGPSI
jgi:hypothetical protein